MNALPVSRRALPKTEEPAHQEKSYPALDFAKRLDTALHGHPLAPQGHGRQRWLRDLVEERTNLRVSPEAVRKWFAGEARPRPDVMKKIAQALEVDEAWLSLGITPTETPVEARKRNAAAEGAVNLVAGLIQISGGHIAFPSGPDDGADIYAIVNGKKLEIEVKLARRVDDGRYQFTFSPRASADILIGVVPTEKHLGAKLLLISKDVLKASGRRRGGYAEIEIDVRGQTWHTGETSIPLVTSIKSLVSA